MVPPMREALEALLASAAKPRTWCLNVAFGAETIAVDTHIFRVATAPNSRPQKSA